MIGIYFSGTGNSKYCVETFVHEYDGASAAFSIEDSQLLRELHQQEEIVIGYPVQYSNIPKILKDFITAHSAVWDKKRIFILATMGLFSGDGAGVLARYLKQYGAVITGGLHLKMPDSIGDEKVLKRSMEKNKELVKKAEQKIKLSVKHMKEQRPDQEGIGILSHLAGLFGQRLYFKNATNNYSDKLKIDASKCIGCGLCVTLCPMKNITLKDTAKADGRCTMCYRCVNRCPRQAVTLLGKRVVEQGTIEKYT